ncbi:MAG: DUF484 family protein [Betaproteobacteria bacterium]|jgi:uncharacterized protein YigA (DUF484 family)|nr:DUF484 family protein [Betaproteobacteria bacterium]NBT97666.1 DUF484 family protein [Betaproteobacteria bacterium]NCX02241.1 DUF484 family protein [Betaproteobacteria bacterium]
MVVPLQGKDVPRLAKWLNSGVFMSEGRNEDNEQQIARWLKSNPEFLQRHPELLSQMKMPDLHAGRAISLHERQLEVMREKHRQLEHRLADLMRVAQENDLIGEKMQRFTRQLLLHEERSSLDRRLIALLEEIFQVPQVGLRVWPLGAARLEPGLELPLSGDELDRVDQMQQPLCGSPAQKPGVIWLADRGQNARSVALLALRRGVEPQAFGLLVLGSADPDRFHAQMGTAFLQRLAELVSAALTPALGALWAKEKRPHAPSEPSQASDRSQPANA